MRSRTAQTIGTAVVTLAAGLATSPALALNGPANSAPASFVAKIDIGSSDSQRACTGTLVDTQWVLTAATCFAPNGKPAAGKPALKTTVTVGRADLSQSGGSVQEAVELVPHPDRDLVMVKLAKRIFDPAITPLRVSATPAADGEQLTHIGYGRTATEWVPNKAHSGQFTVAGTNGAKLAVNGSQDATVCQGDAGSPAIRTVEGTPELVAVNSASWQGGCLGADPTQTRTDAVDTRVDDVADWVAKNRLATMHADVTTVVTTADFNGDGRPDVAAITKDGNLHAFYTTASGTLIYGRELWKHDGSWSRKSRIFGGDFNGDGNADIAAMNVDGVLSLYPGTSAGPLTSGIAMWKDDSWGSFPNIATYRAKGWTRDGLVTVAPSGRLYAYPTGTAGALDGTRTEVWHDDSWNKKLITSDDFTSDQLNDIAAIGQDGALGLY
ncbi:trypsin-like serine protease, partial [Streptomyces sp. NPDC016845]|uniref:trypsin-like serine protease n=1 Tax=Streptomyces sp. NPDC016845 TaxID=3364972 RepID=UPI0037AB11A2